MRMASNLLIEDPERPSGVRRFWTRVIPELAKRLESGEELHLRDLGLRRGAQFSWEATAASTPGMYREAAERREDRRK
jgi:hypothetical protein